MLLFLIIPPDYTNNVISMQVMGNKIHSPYV